MEYTGVIKPTRYEYIPLDFFIGDPDVQTSIRTQASLGYQFAHRFNPAFELRHYARYTNINTDYKTLVWDTLQADEQTITRFASGGTDTLQQLVIDNQLQGDFIYGNLAHKILVGLDYQHNERDYLRGLNNHVPSLNWRNPVYGTGDVVLAPCDDANTMTYQLGLYVQDQIDIGKLTLNVAGVTIRPARISVITCQIPPLKGLGVRYIGASKGDDTNSFEVVGVTLLDAFISYDMGVNTKSLAGIQLQLNASNLRDKRYVASCASRSACFYGSR